MFCTFYVLPSLTNLNMLFFVLLISLAIKGDLADLPTLCTITQGVLFLKHVICLLVETDETNPNNICIKLLRIVSQTMYVEKEAYTINQQFTMIECLLNLTFNISPLVVVNKLHPKTKHGKTCYYLQEEAHACLLHKNDLYTIQSLKDY